MNNITDYSKVTLGLDIGDRRTVYAVLDADGKLVEEDKFATNRETVLKMCSRFKGATVVLEVGAHSRWISQLFLEMGCKVHVANARQLKLIYASVDKDDRLDARRLAKLGQYDPELLRPSQHRSDDLQADLEFIKARAILVRARTMLINHVRGVLKSFGVKPPKCTTKAFTARVRSVIPQILEAALFAILEQIDEISAKISTFDKELEIMSQGKYEKQAELVRQVTGVGVLTGLTYILTIGEPSRFSKSRDVGSYLGLRPRRFQSGDKSPELRTTRKGDRFLRSLLVQSAHYILGPFGQDSALRRWGLSKAQGGARNKKRAVVAVARKLAVLLHRLMMTGEVYDPMRGCKEQDSATTLAA